MASRALLLAALFAVPLAACAWMVWLTHRSSKRKRAPAAPPATPLGDLLEAVKTAVAQARDASLELALRSRLEAARVLPAAERRLVVLEIAFELERLAPGRIDGLALAGALPADDLAARLLELEPHAQVGRVAQEVVSRLREQLDAVLGPKGAAVRLAESGPLPVDVPGWAAFTTREELARWIARLVARAGSGLGADRMAGLLESAARDVGKRVPLAAFPELLRAMPEGVLTAEKSYAAAREALWKEFLQTRRELRTAQDQLSRSQAAAMVAELAATLAHEINNPLGSVLGIIQLLRGSAPPASRQAGLLAAAEGEAKRIKELAGRLGRLVERQRGPHGETSVPELIESALAIVDERASAANVQFERTPDAAVRLSGDPEELRQALVHVLASSISEMESAGGVVRVESQAAEAGAVALRVHSQGPGIAPELLERIFEPERVEALFHPLHEVRAALPRAALGLKAAERIAASHHGRLSVRSGAGQGTVYELVLPCSDERDRSEP